MAECNWDPSKHGGKPCPIHGAGKRSTDNPYSKGSLSDIEKQGWEGKHNYIINRMYNSNYDTIDEVMEDAERMDLDEKQMQYVEAVARRVFGEDFEDEKEEPFDDDNDFDDWDDNAGDAREILGRIEDAETPEELEEVRETLEDWYDQGMLVWDDYNGLKEEIDKAKKQFGEDFDADDDFDNDDFGTSEEQGMSFEEAKKFIKEKLGVDIDEETYKMIKGFK